MRHFPLQKNALLKEKRPTLHFFLTKRLTAKTT